MLKLLPIALFFGATLAAPAFGAESAQTPKPLVAVVDVTSPPTMMGLAAQVTREVLKAAASQDYPVIGPDDIHRQLGDKAYTELQMCGGNTTCVLSRLSSIKADRVVVGTLGRDQKNYLVRLWLLDLTKARVITDINRAILIASRRLNQDVTAAVPALLRGESEALGTLKLSSNVKRVSVTVNGEDKGFTPLTLELKPGKHEVHLEKIAYMPVDRLLTIEPGQVTEEEVRLIVVPGQTPEEELPPPALVAEAAASEPGQGLPLPATAWVAGGAAVAAAAVGTVFAASFMSTERLLKSGYDPATGIYQGVRTDALLAQRNATYANVCYAIAGAALVTGAVLTLIENPEPEAPKAEVTAAPTGSGGGLWVRGSF